MDILYGQSVVCTSRDLRRVRTKRNRSNTYIYCRKLRCGMMSVDLIDYGTMVPTEHTFVCLLLPPENSCRKKKKCNNKFTSHCSSAAAADAPCHISLNFLLLNLLGRHTHAHRPSGEAVLTLAHTHLPNRVMVNIECVHMMANRLH